ncbi:hypothetical protein BJX99DRAFT_254875 [Aspergillus californicus]
MRRTQTAKHTTSSQPKFTDGKYCQYMFSEGHLGTELPYDSPFQLALGAIKSFQPRQLSDAPRSLAGNIPLLALRNNTDPFRYAAADITLSGSVAVLRHVPGDGQSSTKIKPPAKDENSKPHK